MVFGEGDFRAEPISNSSRIRELGSERNQGNFAGKSVSKFEDTVLSEARKVARASFCTNTHRCEKGENVKWKFERARRLSTSQKSGLVKKIG